MPQHLLERPAFVRVAGVFDAASVLGLVAPVLVHPHPPLGVLADFFLEDVPDALHGLGVGLVLAEVDGVQDHHFVAAIFQGAAHGGLDG